jgi:hypothetical protein
VASTVDQVFQVPEDQWALKALSDAKVCEVATVNKVIEVKKVPKVKLNQSLAEPGKPANEVL